MVMAIMDLFILGCFATLWTVCECNLDVVPLGKFEATDRTENFANYRNSMRTEFKGFKFSGLTGKVSHEFSPAMDGRNATYFHAFSLSNSTYKQNLTFELSVEKIGNFNGTAFRYKYYYLPDQGFHAEYHVPEDNPMPIHHLYLLDDEGFELIYKIGEVIATRWYKRLPVDLSAISQNPAKTRTADGRTTSVPSKTTKTN